MWWLADYGERCGGEWTQKGVRELVRNSHGFLFFFFFHFSAHSRVGCVVLGVSMAQWCPLGRELALALVYSWEHHQSLGTLLSNEPHLAQARAQGYNSVNVGAGRRAHRHPCALLSLRISIPPPPTCKLSPSYTEGPEYLSPSAGTPSPCFPTAPSLKLYSELLRCPQGHQPSLSAGARPLTCPWSALLQPVLPLWSRPAVGSFHLHSYLPLHSDTPSPTDSHLLGSRGVSRHFPGR